MGCDVEPRQRLEILAPAILGRPRVDVTLRISGLFRDVFPQQIALFHAAAQAVAARDDETRQPACAGEAAPRVFGAAPGAYGTGVARAALGGDWERRDDLGEAYLAATGFAYDGGEARETDAFRRKVAEAQAFVHVQDMAGQDVLDSDAFAEHEGGFAAAAAALGAKPALYHLDATDPEAPKARPLAQEIARVAPGARDQSGWLKGQMRHGFRGAAEIAETVDNLFASRPPPTPSPTAISICCSTPSAATTRCARSSSAPTRRPPPPSPTASPRRCSAASG